MAGSYEIKKSTDGQFYFNLKAGNGEIILHSERYKAKASAENGIASVQKHCTLDGQYEKKTSSNGQFHFNLKARNNEIIGSSELYKSESSRDNGIASVKANGVTTAIQDLTTA